MRKYRLISLVILSLLAVGLLISAGQTAQAQETTNYLVNPGFEGAYSAYTPETAAEQADCPMGICSTAQVPTGWKPWWVKERPTDANPEYKPAEAIHVPDRVHGGSRAGQYFSFWRTHKAGFRQTLDVPENSTLRFSIWGQAWLSEQDDSSVSDYSGTVNMRIGIDPTGGTNVYSPEIVWSATVQPFDAYQLFSVEAQAQGSRVTVFTFSAPAVNPNSPEFGFKHNDIYWDDAVLEVIGGGAPGPVTTSGDANNDPAAPVAVAAPPAGPTSTPNAEGIIYSQVQPGDSIWSIAAKAGITLDQILEYNNLSSSDFVQVGDLLIVGYGDPPSEEPEEEAADSEDTQEEAAPEPTNTPAPTATAEGIAMVQEEEAGISVCLKAFEDNNQNGLHDSGEALKASVAFTISDEEQVVSNYVTDGVSEPFCIKGLEAGSYRVTRSTTSNEVMTTSGDRSISLTEGGSLTLEFGSYTSAEALASNTDDAAADSTSGDLANTAAADVDDGSNTIVIIAVGLAILVLVAVLVFLFSRRRAI